VHRLSSISFAPPTYFPPCRFPFPLLLGSPHPKSDFVVYVSLASEFPPSLTNLGV